MNHLSPHNVLSILEAGGNLHPIDRSLLMLNYACPEMKHEDLVKLKISELDRMLFELRELLFGTVLNGFSDCSECHEAIEFFLDMDVFQPRQKRTELTEQYTLIIEGFEVTYRIPNILDVADIAQYQDVHKAKQELIKCCFIRIRKNKKNIAVNLLPKNIIDLLGERISERDPFFEITLEYKCPECGSVGSVKLDIQKFLWQEIAMYGKQLLHDVDLLAGEYGWSEKYILEMSEWRRHSYINILYS